MSRWFQKSAKRAGLAPGTVTYVGEPRQGRVRVRYFDYDAERLTEEEPTSVDACLPLKERPTVSWINIDGLHDTAQLERLGQHFELHPLVLEDIVHTQQRPKLEDYEQYVYIVLRMLSFDEEKLEVATEQVSLVLGRGYVISFQERAGDVFEAVRERLRRGKGRARRMGADYLAYMLFDAIVDHYFVVLERIGEEIESLERALMEDPRAELLSSIHRLKREMILLRRAIWPLREVVAALTREDVPLVRAEIQPFLRDVYDHTIQVIDGIESYRDMLTGLQDLYLSSVSNRMNEVMKVLTVIATVFIPLGFLAGVFGMNFEHMPGLGWKWSYPLFWLVILLLGGGMFAYFRRKRWL